MIGERANVLRNKQILFPIIVLVLLSGFWFYIKSIDFSSSEDIRQIWAAVYQVVALYGGILGLYISRRWGGYKSIVGKALIFFSIGLLLQSFGQTIYSYYIFFKGIATPYPSLGDIGFFGSVLSYIYAVILLCKISGIRSSLSLVMNKLWAILIPVIMLLLSYFTFLKDYDFSSATYLRIFLDFGYPIGQALYVSIAIIALLLSTDILGGIMKKPIIFLILALIFQYISDFVFLYQASIGTWYVGGVNDLLYLISYFLMTLALVYTGNVFYSIKNSTSDSI